MGLIMSTKDANIKKALTELEPTCHIEKSTGEWQCTGKIPTRDGELVGSITASVQGNKLIFRPTGGNALVQMALKEYLRRNIMSTI